LKKTLLLLFFLSNILLFSQTFKVNKLNSSAILSSMVILDLSNNYFDEKMLPDLNENDINTLSKDDVPFFDRIAFQPYSVKLKDWSDYTIYLTIGSTLFLTYDKEYWKDNLVVLGEILITQSAIGKWTKTLTHRKRPFVYDENISLEKKIANNSQHSFYSLHSSTAFAAATFGYFYYLDNQGKNYFIASLLFGSATATACLRVASANHFPSDVVVGAIMGSGISYLICKFHHSEKIQWKFGLNDIRVSYLF